MILYLDAKTKCMDVVLDFIEVRLSSGRQVSLNWDESNIERKENGFSARYKGVYFDEDCANGRIDELRNMQIVELGLYSEKENNFPVIITEMLFEDGNSSLAFSEPMQII